MKQLVLLPAVLAAACSYPLPAPTAPTALPAALPTAASVSYLELAGSTPDFQTGKAQIVVTPRDEFGRNVSGTDASCSTTTGTVIPSRVSGPGVIMLQATTNATVRCRSDNGAEGMVQVDMSAWLVELVNQQWIAFGEHAGWSAVTIQSWPRYQSAPPVSSISLDWGDGSASEPVNITADRSTYMQHRYARDGQYVTTARLTWSNGATSQSRLIYGGPGR